MLSSVFGSAVLIIIMTVQIPCWRIFLLQGFQAECYGPSPVAGLDFLICSRILR